MEKWLIPCNPKLYNVFGAFEKLKKLDWKQSSTKIEVGDIAYIYISSPISAVKYKCRVNKVNLETIEIDDSEFVINGNQYLKGAHMELELLEIYDDNRYSIDYLREKGLVGNIQRQQRDKGYIL